MGNASRRNLPYINFFSILISMSVFNGPIFITSKPKVTFKSGDNASVKLFIYDKPLQITFARKFFERKENVQNLLLVVILCSLYQSV